MLVNYVLFHLVRIRPPVEKAIFNLLKLLLEFDFKFLYIHESISKPLKNSNAKKAILVDQHIGNCVTRFTTCCS